MYCSKVIITNQKRTSNRYSFEEEVGLSSYDLALISINKIDNSSKSYQNDFSKITFLI
tara:strand:- start:307 stop:480 length:174 start_codon:yes stop_codon:yes gene_type:complete